MTRYGKREKKQGEKKPDHHGAIVRNVKEEIKESSDICFDTILFAIDSDPEDEDEEVQQNRKVRDAMLSYIFSLREVHMTDFLVAKTEELQSEDGKKIEGYKGEIKGYKERLKKVNTSATEALDELGKKKEENITIIKTLIERQRKNKEDVNTDDLVVAHTWSIDDAWQWLKKEKNF